MLRKIFFLSLMSFCMAFANELPNETPVGAEAPSSVASNTCSAKVTIIDSNGETAYEPTIHVEFNSGGFNNGFKKFKGDKNGVVVVTWCESQWGSSFKCSMTIGTGVLTTSWTKSTETFTMSDGGSYTFDVRKVGY